jgi:hypothetical protein
MLWLVTRAKEGLPAGYACEYPTEGTFAGACGQQGQLMAGGIGSGGSATTKMTEEDVVHICMTRSN